MAKSSGRGERCRLRRCRCRCRHRSRRVNGCEIMKIESLIFVVRCDDNVNFGCGHWKCRAELVDSGEPNLLFLFFFPFFFFVFSFRKHFEMLTNHFDRNKHVTNLVNAKRFRSYVNEFSQENYIKIGKDLYKYDETMDELIRGDRRYRKKENRVKLF